MLSQDMKIQRKNKEFEMVFFFYVLRLMRRGRGRDLTYFFGGFFLRGVRGKKGGKLPR